jgi:hypothetical protein
MFDSRKRTKIKNNKIQAWRLELGSFCYTVEYRPGKDNVAPDSFTRAFSASMSSNNLEEIHIGLCHPGVTRMLHFVKCKNLPYSTEEVKKVCSACRRCQNWRLSFNVRSSPETSSKPHSLWGDFVSTSRVHYLLLLVMHIYSLLWMSTPVSHLHFHVQICNPQPSSCVWISYSIFVACQTIFTQILHGTSFLSR